MGTPAFEKEMWRGLPQLKKIMRRGLPQLKKIMRRGLPQEKKKKNGGDSRKRKKKMWRGLPQLNDDMVGTPTRKGLGLQQMYGVVNLISKYEEEENWHHTIKYKGKLDSGNVSMVG